MYCRKEKMYARADEKSNFPNTTEKKKLPNSFPDSPLLTILHAREIRNHHHAETTLRPGDGTSEEETHRRATEENFTFPEPTRRRFESRLVGAIGNAFEERERERREENDGVRRGDHGR